MLGKEVLTMNETLKVLKERRSIRKYKAEQIRDEELNAILEAGTWAASGKGLQSAVMVVVQDAETISMLSRANAEIQGKPGADPFYGAPTAVVVLADGEAANWLQDGSLVMGNLMTAAASLGVGSAAGPDHGPVSGRLRWFQGRDRQGGSPRRDPGGAGPR